MAGRDQSVNTDSADVNNRVLNNRVIWIDILRVYAILSVVLLHCAAPILYQYGKISLNRWMIANIYDSFAKACVPLFIMISGLLLLGNTRDEPIKTFFIKRMKRVFIPFVFWGMIYMGWRAFFYKQNITPGVVLKEFVSGPVYSHFWYIYVILGLYLVTPIFRQYVKNADKYNILYFVGLWFLTNSIYQLVTKLFNIAIALNLQMFTGLIGYFVGGYLLRQFKAARKIMLGAYAAAIGGLLVTVLGTYYFTMKNNGAFDGYFYDYLSPNIVVMSMGVFFIFMNTDFGYIKRKAPILKKAILAISDASFGIYFVHLIVLELLNRGVKGFSINGLTFNPIVSIPLTCILVFAVSLVLIIVLRKVPLLKNLVS